MALSDNRAIIKDGAKVGDTQPMKDSLLEIEDDGSITTPGDVTLTARWATADVNNTISLFQAYMEYKD